MTIGLFLDVDNTLTRDYIQRAVSLHFGFEEEYMRLEQRFSDGLSSDQFGVEMISLLNQHGGGKQLGEDEVWNIVDKQPHADRLLKLDVEKYLVSSGPSYYVRALAQKYQIPDANVLFSDYVYHGDKYTECIAVSDAEKANFVHSRQKNHSVTVGVGDSAEKDGGFLTACDIPILLKEPPRNSGYFKAESLGDVHQMVKRLTAKYPNSGKKPGLFIGSSTESVDWANALSAALDRICQPYPWTTSFQTGMQLEGLLSRLDSCKYAAFFLTADITTCVNQPPGTGRGGDQWARSPGGFHLIDKPSKITDNRMHHPACLP